MTNERNIGVLPLDAVPDVRDYWDDATSTHQMNLAKNT